MTRSLRYAAVSLSGLTRENNEDTAVAGPRLIAVADGMGGHAAGEIASQLVISEIAPLNHGASGEALPDELARAVERGNAAIGRYLVDKPRHAGMGTTLTALLFSQDTLVLAHIGDSRAYVLRDGELSQITKDDTLVQALVDEGSLASEQAANHPQRATVLRALQGDRLEVSYTTRPAVAGDRYVLCSDGISDYVSHDAMTAAVAHEDPETAAEALVRLALRCQSRDNVTCVVGDVVDGASGYDIPYITGAGVNRRGVLARVTG